MATVKDFDLKPFLGLTKKGQDTLESMSWRVVNIREWYEYVNSKKTDHRLGTTFTLMSDKTFEALDFKTEQMFDAEKFADMIGKEVMLTISEVKPYVQTQGNFSKLAVKIVGNVDFMDKKQPQQGQK
jgi:hypothetical protein